MDGILKIMKKKTVLLELSFWEIDSESLSKLFSSFTQDYNVALLLNNIKWNLITPINITTTSNFSLSELGILNKRNHSDNLNKHVLTLIDFIGVSIISSPKFKGFYIDAHDSDIC